MCKHRLKPNTCGYGSIAVTIQLFSEVTKQTNTNFPEWDHQICKGGFSPSRAGTRVGIKKYCNGNPRGSKSRAHISVGLRVGFGAAGHSDPPGGTVSLRMLSAL